MSSAEPDTEELERFRAAWRAELQRKRTGNNAQSSTVDAPSSATEALVKIPLDGHPVPRVKASVPVISGHASTVHIPPKAAKALETYRAAISCEQAGDTDGALSLYQRAFRLEPRVDRYYAWTESTQFLAAHVDDHAPSEATATEDVVQKLNQLSLDSGRPLVSIVDANLEAIVAELSSHPLGFQKADDKKYSFFEDMSEELVARILALLDHTSVERFALTCRNARLLTLDLGIWREQVIHAYAPPQLPDADSVLKVMTSYALNFRKMFIEHPRVRTDGVYIAVCHYIRNGQGENHWVNTTHLIVYHRYLRFYPNGQVLSLLANQEQYSPSDVIPILKPTLQMKGLFIGTWSLDDKTVRIDSLVEVSAANSSKYSFAMALSLQSRPMEGRWNRLDLDAYDSIKIETGDTCPVVLKNERPFWFSKVRSYASQATF